MVCKARACRYGLYSAPEEEDLCLPDYPCWFTTLLSHAVLRWDLHRRRPWKQRFHRSKAPTQDELTTLVHTLSHSIARSLEMQGLLERDAENTWLTLEEDEEDTLTQLHGHSVTYRIDTGPQQGRKGFTLQTLPGREDSSKTNSRVANQQGSPCTPV